MPFIDHDAFSNKQLRNTAYGFFTTEQGTSTGSYLVTGEASRNVNIYSPTCPKVEFRDSAQTVHDNIMRCLKELCSEAFRFQSINHTFIMTTNYAKGGVNVLTVTAKNFREIVDSVKRTTANLGIDGELLRMLHRDNIDILCADAVVLKGIPDQRICVGGAAADAHPIILIDDENKVCAYIAGSHAGIKAGAYEQTIVHMEALGADRAKIHTVIGPGLGPNSYEFGYQPDYFGEAYQKHMEPVKDQSNQPKCLVHFVDIIRQKSVEQGINPANVHDVEIDTLSYDAYRPPPERLKATAVDFADLIASGPLYFSARRSIKERNGDSTSENPGLHNTVARHFSAVCLYGGT